MSAVLTLAVKELRVLARDRQAALLLFAMPAVSVFFLSLALERVYGEKVGVQLGLVLEVEDEGEFARRIASTLLEGGDFRPVVRPEGRTNAELFRSGAAHGAVRIPAGFSADAEALLQAPEDDRERARDVAHKIEWQVSPALDASYRWLLEARLALTCTRLVQAELERGQAQLGAKLAAMGAELERMGAQLDAMGAELEATGGELERTGAMLAETGELLATTAGELETTVGLLEKAAALLGGSARELEQAGLLAAMESAAALEAEAARAALARLGLLPEGVELEEPPPPRPSFEPPPRRERPAAREPGRGSGTAADPEREAATPAPGAVGEGAQRAAIEASAELFLAETRGEAGTLPTPLQQTIPGWTLFAMFFIVVPLAHALHRERSEGTLRRILALGVPASVLVLGRVLPYLLVGLLQFGCMLAVGLYVLPLVSPMSLELGANAPVLVPITLVCAFAATSYGLMVAALARTPEQAAAIGATSVIVLAVMGGIMVPVFVMPEALQTLARASPLYWGHRAYLEFFVHGAGLDEVRRPLALLLAFSAACLAVAGRRVARPGP